jgi:hypothetical protein
VAAVVALIDRPWSRRVDDRERVLTARLARTGGAATQGNEDARKRLKELE